MSSYQTEIRDGIYDAILAAGSGYVITDFNLSKTYFPSLYLEDIGDKPEVLVTAMGMGTERDRRLRNVAVKVLRLGVLVHVLQRVDRTDTSTIDQLVEMVEQIMNTVEDDELVSGESYNWESTDPVKDENGLIYDYEALYESGVFQAVFTVNFTYILQ